MATVNIVKLITGEELIAELISIDDEKIHIFRNALQLIPTEKSYVMAPFLPLTDSEVIRIKDSHVVVCELAAEKTANQYLRVFDDSPSLYVPPSTKIVY